MKLQYRLIVRLVNSFIGTLAIVLMTACSSLGVEPWERDLLSETAMQIEGDSLDSSFDDHIYFSKEASSGGSSFSGGGCGCN